MRVLVVEDEPALAEAVRHGLSLEAMAVDVAIDGEQALERVSVNDYDVVVLDRNLPKMHGDAVAAEISSKHPAVRILMLTAARGLSDKIAGFESGADDYLAKPFDFAELVVRVRALARRTGPSRPATLEFSDLRLDPFRREVYRAGRYVRLARKEFAVLEVLLKAEGGVVSAETLIEKAWDENADPFSNAVRVTVSTLRSRLVPGRPSGAGCLSALLEKWTGSALVVSIRRCNMGLVTGRSSLSSRRVKKGPGRRPLSDARKRFLQLRARGWTLAAARRAVGVSKTTAHNWTHGRTVRRKDGSVVRVPPLDRGIARPISARYLSEEERFQIADLRRAGVTIRAIGAELRRAPSTISRELRRNATTTGQYRPYQAQRRAVERRRRTRASKLAANRTLFAFVRDRLAKRWSPAQISRDLREQHPDEPMMRVAVETIYRALYRPHSALFRLAAGKSPLRTGRTARRAHRRMPAGWKRARFASPMLMIADRPFAPEDRSQHGHWEGDLIVGLGYRSAIGTLVDRKLRFVKLLHLPSPDSNALLAALIGELGHLPPELRRSITWDQGTEMARHLEVGKALDTKVYFCDPGSPWQRGSNENTNGLLRQYFPKGTDLARHTPADLARVALELNERPRAILDHQALARLFTALLPSR